MGTGDERPVAQLAAEITGAAVRMAAATAAWLLLVAEFDRREGWAGPGVTSCAHWLAWQCGLSPGAAREHVRVARALGGLPRITAAFAAGRISYAKVRALTRVADPACEADLLELALHTTASQVERTVRAWRRAAAPDTESLAARARFEYWWDDDGMLVFRGRADPDVGAELVAAIESMVERDARRERAAANRTRTGRAASEAAAGKPHVPGSPAEDALGRAGGIGRAGKIGRAGEAGEVDEVDEVAAARQRRQRGAALRSPGWPPRPPTPTAAPATHPAARWWCTSTPTCWPTTPRRGRPTSRAVRRSPAARCCGWPARPPRW